MKRKAKRPRNSRRRTAVTARPAPRAPLRRETPIISKTPAASPYGPLDVPARDIAHLSSARLLALVHSLARAEAAIQGIPLSEVLFVAEERAADGGRDGQTPAHQGHSDWLPAEETCWQLKAGKAGEPKKVATELTGKGKTDAKETLRRRGHYVVVTSGSVSGGTGRKARLDALKRAAKNALLPSSRIRVYTSESISEWLRRFPGLAARILGRQGFLTVEQWRAYRTEHRHSYQPSATQRAQLEALTRSLDVSASSSGTARHFATRFSVWRS